MTTLNTEGRTLRWARLYDLGTTLMGRPIRALQGRLLEQAAIAPEERVLDVGCGPGRLTQEAARAAGPGGETLGIDASPEMIALARRKAARAGSLATFRLAAIEAIPTPDSRFDVALASLMLHHLPEDLQRRGLAEILRVLKPEGRFVALEFSAMPGHGLGHLLAMFGLPRGTEHAEHLRRRVEEAGFIRVEVAPAGRAFFVLRARKRKSIH